MSVYTTQDSIYFPFEMYMYEYVSISFYQKNYKNLTNVKTFYSLDNKTVKKYSGPDAFHHISRWRLSLWFSASKA